MAPLKTLRFEPLTEAHIPRVAEIEQVSNGAPWSEKSFRNELTSPQSVFRVAIESGKVVGLPETPAVTLADKRTKSEMALEFAQLSTASYGRFDKR